MSQTSTSRRACQRKRIAIFIGGSRHLGGAERRFYRLFRYLQAQRGDIYLYTTETGLDASEASGIAFERTNVRVLPNAAVKARILRYPAIFIQAMRLRALARQDRIDHLHFGENPGPLSFVYGLLARSSPSFSVSLVDSIGSYQRNWRQRLYTSMTIRFSAKVDCLSSEIRNSLSAFLHGRCDEKLTIAPCSFTDLDRAALAKPTGGEQRDIDIVMMARMTPMKGHQLLRDALQVLGSKGYRDLVVHVCGSGPLEEEIRMDFTEVEGQRISIYFEREPFRILHRAKIFVSLQDRENYPSQSLLEAMACECAVVATDVGMTRALLNDECASLVQSNVAAVADAMAALLQSEERRVRLGKNASAVVTASQNVGQFSDYFLQEVCGASVDTRLVN